MTASLSLHAGELRRLDTPPDSAGDEGPLHGIHVHGSLQLRLEEAVCTIASKDVCLNGFAAALRQLRDHVCLGSRQVDPTTYWLRGPSGWPLLEFLRMYDSVRVAVLVDGEGDSTVTSVGDFQDAADDFLETMTNMLHAGNSHGFDDTTGQAENIAARRCQVFQIARAAQGHPAPLQDAADPARVADKNAAMVMCIRIGDMDATPAGGSLRGRCMQCGSPVWIAPSSRVIIEEQSRPVYCIQCASS